jgi:PPOX class probable F420-dependent enzyme
MPTLPDSYRDLLTAPGVVILTTINPDGTPQTSALWFLLDEDGKLKLSLNRSRQKAKNLERNPNVTLFFIDLNNPYRTLEVRGKAVVDPDGSALAEKVSAKYGSRVQDNDRPGEQRIAVTIEPTKVNTFPPA